MKKVIWFYLDGVAWKDYKLVIINTYSNKVLKKEFWHLIFLLLDHTWYVAVNVSLYEIQADIIESNPSPFHLIPNFRTSLGNHLQHVHLQLMALVPRQLKWMPKVSLSIIHYFLRHWVRLIWVQIHQIWASEEVI